MDYQALRALIDAHSEWAEVSDAEVAAACNAKTETRAVTRYITQRTLLAEFGLSATDSIMEALKTAGASSTAMKRAHDLLAYVGEGAGIDIGHPKTRAALPALVAQGICTQAQADALLALGVETVSPAEAAGLGQVLEGHVTKARAL